jgi:hypothetical protein
LPVKQQLHFQFALVAQTATKYNFFKLESKLPQKLNEFNIAQVVTLLRDHTENEM